MWLIFLNIFISTISHPPWLFKTLMLCGRYVWFRKPETPQAFPGLLGDDVVQETFHLSSLTQTPSQTRRILCILMGVYFHGGWPTPPKQDHNNSFTWIVLAKAGSKPVSGIPIGSNHTTQRKHAVAVNAPGLDAADGSTACYQSMRDMRRDPERRLHGGTSSVPSYWSIESMALVTERSPNTPTELHTCSLPTPQTSGSSSLSPAFGPFWRFHPFGMPKMFEQPLVYSINANVNRGRGTPPETISLSRIYSNIIFIILFVGSCNIPAAAGMFRPHRYISLPPGGTSVAFDLLLKAFCLVVACCSQDGITSQW
ncbi:hypothetical protein B0J14DRAFT_302587 [Halenospora varia]|nr:hypothetical protein B0J14DRAFT_302587 [Halenospora varia]